MVRLCLARIVCAALFACCWANLPTIAQSDSEPGVLPPPGSQLPPLVPPGLSTSSPKSTDDSNQSTLIAPLDTSKVSQVGEQNIAAPLSAFSQESGDLVKIDPVAIPVWYQPAYWFGLVPWDIGFELGLNGTEGINNALSIRTGGHLKLETKFWKYDTSLVYSKNTTNGVETQNNALLDVRVDRLLGESPWSLFYLNQELYDEFQAFDLRVSLNTGVGYQIVDTETTNMLTRFGAGASREFGGPDVRWAPEALFGLDYEHNISRTQRLIATVDYFPEWEDFNLFRVVTDMGWEVDLDQPRNLSLKFSILDRYDSTPNGVDHNEINYAALLIWGL